LTNQAEIFGISWDDVNKYANDLALRSEYKGLTPLEIQELALNNMKNAKKSNVNWEEVTGFADLLNVDNVDYADMVDTGIDLLPVLKDFGIEAEDAASWIGKIYEDMGEEGGEALQNASLDF
jgi:hypothetical protein